MGEGAFLDLLRSKNETFWDSQVDGGAFYKTLQARQEDLYVKSLAPVDIISGDNPKLPKDATNYNDWKARYSEKHFRDADYCIVEG